MGVSLFWSKIIISLKINRKVKILDVKQPWLYWVINYLYQDGSDKRDCLFSLAVGQLKLKDYTTSLKYIRGLLQV